jgi:hypothetical protein
MKSAKGKTKAKAKSSGRTKGGASMGSAKGKTKKKAKSSGDTSERSPAFGMDRRVEYAEGLLASPAGSGVRHNTAVEHLKEKYGVCKRHNEPYRFYTAFIQAQTQFRRLHLYQFGQVLTLISGD